MSRNLLFFLLLVFFTETTVNSYSQSSNPINSYGSLSDRVNTITTAVPFLMIAPDSRGGGMGDAGVATSPDANSMHYNAAKYAFAENDMGFSVSYTPWLRALINDINLAYISGYRKFKRNQALSASLRYFALGNITFTDNTGNNIGQYNPNEFAVDVAYSRLLSRKLSGAVALRFIYSNLTGGQLVQNIESHPGIAASSDISIYYQDNFELERRNARFGFGVNISNIGTKISYTANADKDFIPVNLKVGGCLTLNIDDYNSIAFTTELNKLLVPTPPIYKTDSTGYVYDSQGNQVIEKGMDPNVSVVTGIFQSFYDAPGGFKEEFHEITYSLGAEYWYEKQFALRTGYFYENPTKGNRQFFTFGIGLRLNVFGLDFSYLVPTQQRNPLENTLRFTLNFNLESFSAQNEPKTKLPSKQ
ncbi:MAG: type IX secretion system outer membrane channel protein PorV [Bacteroidia bacterium]|nr:type IX secretion system outer membrane channel protein PorV [Bacteroidia bacterium]